MAEIIIRGIRLYDEKGSPFLVVLVPPLAGLSRVEILKLAEIHLGLDGEVVLASRSDTGQFQFSGPDSLTAIAQARIGEHPDWQILPKPEPPPYKPQTDALPDSPTP